MNLDNQVLKKAIVRFLVIACIVIAFSLVVFGSAAFKPELTSFEFVANSVTIAIAYAAFKAHQARNGFAALLVWYLLLTGILFTPHYMSNFIMAASYIVGLTASVYFYLKASDKWFTKNLIQRVVAGALIIGVAHAVIVIFLQVVSLKVFIHPDKSIEWSYLNLKNGTLIGILSVIGMELAEYLLNLTQARSVIIKED
jgi:hypothetical protein